MEGGRQGGREEEREGGREDTRREDDFVEHVKRLRREEEGERDGAGGKGQRVKKEDKKKIEYNRNIKREKKKVTNEMGKKGNEGVVRK